jgi:PAS domain S-box-containing protein
LLQLVDRAPPGFVQTGCRSNLALPVVPPPGILALGMPSLDPLRVLLNGSAMLLGGRTVTQVLDEIVELARQSIAADAYAVWRTYDEGKSWQALTAAGLSEGYRAENQAISGPVPCAPLMVSNVETHPLLQPNRERYSKEGIRSLLVVPMQMAGVGFGTITFYYRTPHTFSEEDLLYATALTNLSAAALRAAELQEENQREKMRLQFLAEASDVLASSLDYETTLDRVAHMAVPHIADWCIVFVLENGKETPLTVAHADPEKLKMVREYATRYPTQLHDDRGLGKVLLTGLPEFYPDIPDHLLVQAAQDEEHLRIIRSLGILSIIIVPLKSRDRVLGALQLIAADQGHRFDKDDLQLAEDLARRAAAAMDNAQIHRELLRNESRLRFSSAVARIGSWTWDPGKNHIHWSEEYRELHGLTPDIEASCERWIELIHPDDRPAILRDLESVLASDALEMVFEHRAISADGRVLWIHSRGTIARDSEGKVLNILGVSMDLTERRETEETLRRAEKLAAAGRLAATVAHEINNPLEAVTNLVYLTRTQDALPAEAVHHLTMAEEELDRVAQIVRQTLGFYRESTSPKWTDLSQVIAGALVVYRRKMEQSKIRLIEQIEPNVSAWVVGGEIQQVVMNLLANATDATIAGGSITIVLRSYDDTAEITVTDTGCGIPAEEHQRIFEPFFSTKKDVGTGLGLWVSQNIAQKHGGTLSFSSRQNAADHGSSFVLSLPVGREHEREAT